MSENVKKTLIGNPKGNVGFHNHHFPGFRYDLFQSIHVSSVKYETTNVHEQFAYSVIRKLHQHIEIQKL